MADIEKSGMATGMAEPNARESGSYNHDPTLEKRVVRKIDTHLMSLFFALYLLAFLDRGNIGNARIAGMAKDLDLNSYRYDWLITIFYISYVLAEFCVLLWKIFPPHLVGASVVFCWGLISSVQAATVNWQGMMALRFLLGIFEAAYGPGIIYLLSFFYLRKELGFRCGIFVSGAPLASTFAGALAYGITSGHSALANWRVLFLVEGLPTIAMSVIAFFFIPDSPEKARFLNAEEKEVVRARVHRQVGTSASQRIGGISIREIFLTVIDPIALLCAITYFCANVTFSSLSVFLPTIIEEMGYTAIDAQGLSAPPSFVAFLASLITTWVADRTQQRCLMIIAMSVVGGIGYVILAAVESVGVRYFATFLISVGVFATIPNINALALSNQGSDTRRGTVVVMIQMVGQCGPFLGAQLFPQSEAPRYVKGMSVCAAFMFLLALLIVAQRLLLAWKNARLDREYGNLSDSNSSTDNMLDKAASENYGPNFRYAY